MQGFQSIENTYYPLIVEAVHARRFDEALRLVTERNQKIHLQRGIKYAYEAGYWRLIEETFTKDLINSKSGLSDQGAGLIFIVGLPRSGKTTLEKLLSGIAGIWAGDEQGFLHDQFHKLQDPNGRAWSYPDYIPHLPDTVWQQFGEAYATPVKQNFKDADFVIDTLPPNFRYAGLIRLLLPHAKMIHMQRDPLRHLIDIYAKVFNNPWHDYSYSWPLLLDVYKSYRSLMAHWDNVLGDWMLNIRFEDLIAHPKKELRRAIDFCGIEADKGPQKLIAPHKDMLSEIAFGDSVLKNYRQHLKDVEKELGAYKRL